jgi:hypothetical protein
MTSYDVPLYLNIYHMTTLHNFQFSSKCLCRTSWTFCTIVIPSSYDELGKSSYVWVNSVYIMEIYSYINVAFFCSPGVASVMGMLAQWQDVKFLCEQRPSVSSCLTPTTVDQTKGPPVLWYVSCSTLNHQYSLSISVWLFRKLLRKIKVLVQHSCVGCYQRWCRIESIGCCNLYRCKNRWRERGM